MSKDRIETLNKICYWLIIQCIESGADEMVVGQEGFHKGKKQLGDWEIVVRRKKTRIKRVVSKTK